MKIILNTTDGNTVSVDVRPEETYRMLRERIHVESGIELEISQIFFDGKQVEEDQNVYESFLGGNILLLLKMKVACHMFKKLIFCLILSQYNLRTMCNKSQTLCVLLKAVLHPS